MFQILIFILGMIAGGAAVWLLKRRAEPESVKKPEKKESLIQRQAKEKQANKKKILGLLETQAPLTNSRIEQVLGISDATATRYLDELEKEGRIRQVGKTGRNVYYESIAQWDLKGSSF